MKLLKKITVIVLCICMVLTLASCQKKPSLFGADRINEFVHSIDLSGVQDAFEKIFYGRKKTSSKKSSIENVNEELIPAYEHYDREKFSKAADSLSELVKNGKTEEALEAYDALSRELYYIDALNSVIFVMYQEDITNEENEAEYEYTDALFTECSDRFCIVGKELADSSFSEDFMSHLNNDALFEKMKSYAQMTDEEKELSIQENNLENRYYEICSDLSKYTYTYDGTTYSLKDFYEGNNIDSMGEAYPAIYSGCMKAFNEKAGEVFLELIKIRDRIAKLNNYDNFAEYADKELYGRDYTDYDLKTLKNAVKANGSVGSNYISFLYNMLPEYEKSATATMKDVSTIIEGISSTADEAMNRLLSQKLYSVGSEDERNDAGFSMAVYHNGVTPFIYMKTKNTAYDVTSLIHESGHFTHFNSVDPNFFVSESFDLCEIHSTGLEVLASAQYGNVFEEQDVKTLGAFTLSSLESSIFSGCMYDEWQRYVYSHPDASLEEYNQKYKELLFSYGKQYTSGQEYEWCFISHNFDAPLYYISYAVSSFVSLQLWQKAQTSYEDAVTAWETLINTPTGAEYRTTIETAGFVFFDNKDVVSEVLNQADEVVIAYFSDLSNSLGYDSIIDIYGGY